MASAQCYWGRLAALLVRVLYALFPQVDWNFVFVDDFLWLLRSEGAVNVAVALLATLLALGTPLSWKKTHLAEVNTWLGFVVHPNIPQVLMAANKHILVMEVLQTMVEGQAMHSKDIEKALGRIQWATAACPLAKSMLQPLWAWKMATTTVGKPPKVVRMLAFMLRFLFNTPFVQYSPYLPKSSWWGCSDASASDDGLAFVGGWCSNTVEPDKKEVYWFHEQIHVEEYPWAFKNGDPKRRIAALEMLGTLFLCNMILTHQGPLSSRVRLPVGSDNQGNVMAMLNLGSKKPYTAAILMELVFLLHTHGCSLAANHVPREFNQWADELTHPDFSGFDPLQRVPKQELCEEFVFLPRLLNGDAFDLSVDPPMLP